MVNLVIGMDWLTCVACVNVAQVKTTASRQGCQDDGGPSVTTGRTDQGKQHIPDLCRTEISVKKLMLEARQRGFKWHLTIHLSFLSDTVTLRRKYKVCSYLEDS